MSEYEKRKLTRVLVRALNDLSDKITLPIKLEKFRIDNFAAVRGAHAPGRKSPQISAANDYQDELAGVYAVWSNKLAADLAKAKSDADRQTLIEDALGLLLLQLTESGHRNLTDAWLLALAGNPPTPDMVSQLQIAMSDNDQYLQASLLPGIREKLLNGLRDPDIIAALALGGGAYAAAIGGVLATLGARVESYSGAQWGLMQMIAGLVIDSLGHQVIAYLDPRAEHCSECPQFHDVGGRVYPSFQDYLNTTGGRVPTQFECNVGCRCEVRDGGGRVVAGNVRGYIGAGA